MRFRSETKPLFTKWEQQREIQNQAARIFYKKVKCKKKSEPTSSSGDSEGKTNSSLLKPLQNGNKKKQIVKKSPRETPFVKDSSKLNIASLFQEEQSKLVHQAFLNLFDELYQNTSIYQKTKWMKLQKVLIKKGRSYLKKEKTLPDFYDLYPDEKDLSLLYVKLLQGSTEHYPSLLDFIRIEEKLKPCHFPTASIPVLTAIIGKDLTQKIVEKEKELETKESLKKGDVETILSSKVETLGLFDYQKIGSKGCNLKIKDPVTKLEMTYQIP